MKPSPFLPGGYIARGKFKKNRSKRNKQKKAFEIECIAKAAVLDALRTVVKNLKPRG